MLKRARGRVGGEDRRGRSASLQARQLVSRRRARSGCLSHATPLSLLLATQADPKVWGENAEQEFRVRPLAEYHKSSIGFMEPALAPDIASPNSRMCPAKDLALTILMEFMTCVVKSAGEGGDFRDVWKAYDKKGEEATTVAVTGFGPGGVSTLKKVVDSSGQNKS